MDQQDKVIEEFNENQKGKKIKVLVEGYDEEEKVYYGRSYMDAPEIDDYISFDLSEGYEGEGPKPGDFVDIKL